MKIPESILKLLSEIKDLSEDSLDGKIDLSDAMYDIRDRMDTIWRKLDD